MKTQTAADTETPENDDTAAVPATRRRVRPLVFGSSALLCAALATAGVLFATHNGNDKNGANARHHSPTVPVAYQITGHGTAQINYAGPDKRLHTVNAHLPWHGNADLTAGTPAVVSIILGKEGGNATCSVSLHGKVVQQATAYGSYGRANCRTPLARTTP
jgi:Mycobacterium membrane protein